MLKTIYLTINALELIFAMLFLIFFIYSLLANWHTINNYKIRVIMTSILCALNIAEVIVSSPLRISTFSSKSLAILWAINVAMNLWIINKKKELDQE